MLHRLATNVTARLVAMGMRRPRRVVWSVVGVVVMLGALMVRIEVDTDPENMLPSDHPVRELNQQMRADFGGDQVVVAGIIADEPLDSEQLTAMSAVHASLLDDAAVLGDEIVSIATVLEAPGAEIVSVEDVASAVAASPLLAGAVLTDDGLAAAIFVPVADKDAAAEVGDRLRQHVGDHPSLADAELHVAGLPLAQDAFGAQMFIQMGVFAPLAGALIFLVMWWFFRRALLVVPAMLVALLTVVATMGLLIGSGNTVHIMSSMIAIFLMPTAILDAVHVLSEFFDRYPAERDRRRTIEHIYGELAAPLLFTTLTTMVGFGSLALAPIPPVRVFGLFVAAGMGIAWLLTVLFLPAYLMSLKPERLERAFSGRDTDNTALARLVRVLGTVPRQRPWVVLAVGAATIALAVPAIPRIDVNDNPVRWFKSDHEVRQATEALNEVLPGTFAANIVLTATQPGALTDAETLAAIESLEAAWAASPLVGSAGTLVDLTGGGTSGSEATAALDRALADSTLARSLVTSEHSAANLRLLLNDGDNRSMQEVIDLTEATLAEQPFPAGVEWAWAGETYLNLVWQEEMVDGMLTAFVSTLVIVFILLALLFRSPGWALLAILPVLWTVVLVYGVMGWIGKDYDMPIAVLSTLVIGIGIDFAIHFVERQRHLRDEYGDTGRALEAFYEEPARALTRNAAIVAIGFTPLLLSSLTPYIVVGVFLSSILLLSWLATLLGLPSLVNVSSRRGGSTPATPNRSVDLSSR